MSELIKLHIGSHPQKPGWKILDTRPGPEIDYVGHIRDLSQFADASCEIVYAAHQLQHVEQHHLVVALKDIGRLLVPGGQLLLSVPDLDALCKLYLEPQLNKSARIQVMRMLFGAQLHDADFNRSGLSFEWLADCLAAAGFGFVRRVDSFDLFDDASNYAPYGSPISLNLIATRIETGNLTANPGESALGFVHDMLSRQTMPLQGLNLTQTQHIAPSVTYPPLSAADAAIIHQKTLQALDFQNNNNIAEARRLFHEILALQPNNFAALYSMAVITSQNEEHTEALDWIRRTIATNPKYAPSFFVEAVVLQALGRFDESLASYERAIEVDPNYESAMINRSNLYYEIKQHVKAVESFADALRVNPMSDKALAGQAIILTEMNRYEDAIPLFERMLEANPDFDYGRGLLFHAEQHCCDWRRFEESRTLIEEGIRSGKKVCKTLPFMALSNSPEDLLKCVKIFADHLFAAKPKSKHLWQGEAYQHDKIRLAYISPDFREHPVGHLMAGIIEHHDKSKFETIGISLGLDDNSSLRSRFKNAFSQFIDVRTRKSWDIAEMIRNLEVDILVDLAGYTADSRTDVFAFRPAPIHVNYLGYPGSLGVDYMDYILADRIVIPEDHKEFYSEKVAYLANAYLPTDSNLKISERTPSREEMGLPATGIVFCSFNHDYKINPAMFDTWMHILDQVPGSILWLMKLTEAAQGNLRREAETRGIDPDRLIFATRVPLVEDHLARYRLADLFLDCTPYNAHTTASDALRVGLPVLTYQGNTFSGRVASSLLTAIGLPEMITQSLEAYQNLAIELAKDPEQLAALKAKLLANQETYPLFKTDLFCQNMEQVFINMLEDHKKAKH